MIGGGRGAPDKMAVFKKHYTREEARQLLPAVVGWIDELARLRDILQECEEQMARQLGQGEDLGGKAVNRSVRAMASIKTVLFEFKRREIQLKDIDRGLVDFPAFIAGREVFLCWEKGEDDIEFWHDLESGYAGREKL